MGQTDKGGIPGNTRTYSFVAVGFWLVSYFLANMAAGPGPGPDVWFICSSVATFLMACIMTLVVIIKLFKWDE